MADWQKIGQKTRFLRKNPHPQGWGYTDKARLRGLRIKTTFDTKSGCLKSIFSLARAGGLRLCSPTLEGAGFYRPLKTGFRIKSIFSLARAGGLRLCSPTLEGAGFDLTGSQV